MDAGNLFFKQDKIDPGISLDIAKENARTIVTSFNHISCSGFSPGMKDFAAGVDFLMELYASSDFDYISCNIKDKNSELLFEPYKIIDIDNLKLGIIGASSYFESNDIFVENAYISISNVLSEIRNECDYIILLFNASSSDYKKLSETDLEIDLAIRGNTNRKSNDGGNNNFPIYSTGDRGKIVYQFDLKHINSSSPLVDIAYFEKAIRTDNKRLNQLNKDTIQINNSQKIAEYHKNIQKYSQIINSVENSLQFKQITLDKFIQDDPYVLKIVDSGKARTQTMGSPMLDPHRFHNH